MKYWKYGKLLDYLSLIFDYQIYILKTIAIYSFYVIQHVSIFNLVLHLEIEAFTDLSILIKDSINFRYNYF